MNGCQIMQSRALIISPLPDIEMPPDLANPSILEQPVYFPVIDVNHIALKLAPECTAGAVTFPFTEKICCLSVTDNHRSGIILDKPVAVCDGGIV